MDTLDMVVAQARRGDQQAFDQVIRETHRELRCFISIRIHSLVDADEIVQDVYVTCYEKMAHYHPENSFMGWLKGIAKNKLRERYRERPLGFHSDTYLEQIIHEEPEDDHSGLLSKHLQACLDKLPRVSRQLIDAMYQDSQPLNEMARRFKRKANSLAQAIGRIRHGLRQCIDQQRGR